MTTDPSPALAANEMYVYVEIGPEAVIPDAVRAAIVDLARALDAEAGYDVSGHSDVPWEEQWGQGPIRFHRNFDPLATKSPPGAKWVGPELDASKNEVIIETLE